MSYRCRTTKILMERVISKWAGEDTTSCGAAGILPPEKIPPRKNSYVILTSRRVGPVAHESWSDTGTLP